MSVPRLTRRALLGLGVAATGVTLDGCGSSPATVRALRTDYAGDAQVAALLYAVEAALLSATAMAVSAAVAGTYGAVPPAVTAALGVAGDHHSQHLGQWRTRLIAAGFAPPPGSALTSQLPQLTQLTAATSMTQVVSLLAAIQRAAVATYLSAAGGVTAAANRTVVAVIAPVEAEHGATWDLLSGVTLTCNARLGAGALTLPSPGH